MTKKNPVALNAILSAFRLQGFSAKRSKLLLGFFGGSSSFSSNVASWYRCGSDGQVVAVGDSGHAFWQGQVSNVNRVANVHVRQVNGDELWQVAWQAFDVQLV